MTGSVFFVQMRRPAQGPAGGWMMPDLVCKWFPLCEFSLCDTTQHLQFSGSLGVSAPTPKAQGLISGQEQRFHKLFVTSLSEIKTNTPNEKPKMYADKWQLQNQANNN